MKLNSEAVYRVALGLEVDLEASASGGAKATGVSTAKEYYDRVRNLKQTCESSSYQTEDDKVRGTHHLTSDCMSDIMTTGVAGMCTAMTAGAGSVACDAIAKIVGPIVGKVMTFFANNFSAIVSFGLIPNACGQYDWGYEPLGMIQTIAIPHYSNLVVGLRDAYVEGTKALLKQFPTEMAALGVSDPSHGKMGQTMYWEKTLVAELENDLPGPFTDVPVTAWPDYDGTLWLKAERHMQRPFVGDSWNWLAEGEAINWEEKKWECNCNGGFCSVCSIPSTASRVELPTFPDGLFPVYENDLPGCPNADHVNKINLKFAEALQARLEWFTRAFHRVLLRTMETLAGWGQQAESARNRAEAQKRIVFQSSPTKLAASQTFANRIALLAPASTPKPVVSQTRQGGFSVMPGMSAALAKAASVGQQTMVTNKTTSPARTTQSKDLSNRQKSAKLFALGSLGLLAVVGLIAIAHKR